MTRLAGNMRMRLVAVLMLLALRPCVIFLTARFLSSQSGTHSRIEYIDDDLAVQHVATARRNALPGAVSHETPSMVATPGLSLAIRRPINFLSICPQWAPPPLAKLSASSLACRAPPWRFSN
jgi:hypothetical protein